MSMQRSVQLLDAIINLAFYDDSDSTSPHVAPAAMAELFVQPQLPDERLCHPLLVFVVFAICPSKIEKGRDLRRALQSFFFSRL
jgi:hypothetical protein